MLQTEKQMGNSYKYTPLTDESSREIFKAQILTTNFSKKSKSLERFPCSSMLPLHSLSERGFRAKKKYIGVKISFLRDRQNINKIT